MDSLPITTIFFDFDGVLTLEESGSLATSKYLEAQTGIPYEKIQQAYADAFPDRDICEGIICKEGWQQACDRLEIDIPWDMLCYAMGHPPSNDAIFDVITKLKEDYQIGLITDNPKERVDLLKEVFDLSQYFDTMTVSGCVECTKKDQKIFDIALKAASVNPAQTVFIDNREGNLQWPKKLGMQTIHYCSETHNLEYLIQALQSVGVTSFLS